MPSMNMASTTGTVSSAMPMSTMMMFSNDNTALSIFSNAFSPKTEAQYVGAWFFAFFLAVSWRALVLAQIRLDEYWMMKYAGSQIVLKDSGEGMRQTSSSRAWRLSTNLPRAALAFVTQGVAYLLMIIVMILNVGLFFAVIIGYFVGELIFGRVGSHSPLETGSCS